MALGFEHATMRNLMKNVPVMAAERVDRIAGEARTARATVASASFAAKWR